MMNFYWIKKFISLVVIVTIIFLLVVNGFQIAAAFFSAVCITTVIFSVGLEIVFRIMEKNGEVTQFMRPYQNAYTTIAFIIALVVFSGFLLPLYYLLIKFDISVATGLPSIFIVSSLMLYWYMVREWDYIAVSLIAGFCAFSPFMALWLIPVFNSIPVN